MIKHIDTLYRLKDGEGTYEYEAVKHLPQEQVRKKGFHFGETITVIQADGTTHIAYVFGEKYYSYNEQEIIELRERHKKNKALKKERERAIMPIISYLNKKSVENIKKIAKAIENLEV
jgi:hypothetical protein